MAHALMIKRWQHANAYKPAQADTRWMRPKAKEGLQCPGDQAFRALYVERLPADTDAGSAVAAIGVYDTTLASAG